MRIFLHSAKMNSANRAMDLTMTPFGRNLLLYGLCVVSSCSPGDIYLNWKLFCDRHSTQQPHATNYIVSSCIPYKENFFAPALISIFILVLEQALGVKVHILSSRDTSILPDVTY
jgi:hypothetical protein